jgi:DNA-binding NarL/FixJ family response regulator
MILFFDDYLGDSMNQLFLYKLRKAVKTTAVEIVGEKTIPAVEAKLRSVAFKAAIMDVMALIPGEPTLSARAGIEVLRRCRSGVYGDLNKAIAIFMRTARGESHIRRMALSYGCTSYFETGRDDDELIDAIVSILSAQERI